MAIVEGLPAMAKRTKCLPQRESTRIHEARWVNPSVCRALGIQNIVTIFADMLNIYFL